MLDKFRSSRQRAMEQGGLVQLPLYEKRTTKVTTKLPPRGQEIQPIQPIQPPDSLKPEILYIPTGVFSNMAGKSPA